MNNHSEWCIKEPGNNCINCCETCSNCEEKESEDDMSDTPRTDSEIVRIKEATKRMDNDSACFENYQCMRDFARDIERELSTMTAERDALKQVDRAACDMARKQIYRCAYMARLVNCKNCEFFKAKKCDARLFLAAHHQPDAWEVKQ